MGLTIMKKKSDTHLHTVVSDGKMTPDDILLCAKELEIEEISITDHDAIGGYRNFGYDPVLKAAEMGLSLIPGIEMDSFYLGVEIHVLGYGIDLENKELNDYLQGVQTLRKQRIREQIEQINRLYQREIIKEESIFLKERDALMNPHLIHPLLELGLFPGYREAARWVKDNAKSSVILPKPSTQEVIELIKRAGGLAYMAHPGYYIIEKGLDIDKALSQLIPHGLDGLEVEFPYFNTSPQFKLKEVEPQILERIDQAAHRYGLLKCRGSDSHTIEQLRAFNSSSPK